MTITSATAAQPVAPVQNSSAPKAAAPAASAPKQDSVHLSAAALAASGDADHDGDSH